ncbi:MAG TPA: SpoIID/LytB domain-containing protein [Anaeromyxobacteraceae bacterium]|nr:SpoIID/LytB domain-containing protein [Anaeromyxobacteraceae bacterium]
MRPGLLLALAALACATPPSPREAGEGAAAATSVTTPPPTPAARAPSPPGRGHPDPSAAGEGEGATPATTDLPHPLPPPLPPPGVAEEPPPPPPSRAEPQDPLELLWSHRLNFAAGGAPLVTIRLMEGQSEIAFRPRGPARLKPRGGVEVTLPGGATARVRLRDGRPATLAHFPLLGQFEFRDRTGLEAARRLWERRGARPRLRVLGGVYGILGRVIDNRKHLLLADGDGSEATARAFVEEAGRAFGDRPGTFTDLVTPPGGTLEILDAGGRRLATGEGVVSLDVENDAGFVVWRVEHDVGYAAHGFEDRAYRGRLHVTVDASGRLAAVHALPLEELLRGLVPSEMPAGVAPEALKAQAVTARSNVLAQIGTRHLTDPYVLCAEVHCQAYRGEAAQVSATDAAVRATAGEALFGRRDRSLVDGVYHAMCGGHGEDNEAVWGNIPDANLRGRADLPAAEAAAWKGGLGDETRLGAFLAEAPRAWCARPANGRPDRYRWERRFTQAEVDQVAAPLGTGAVTAMAVPARGVSGRALTLRVDGAQGSAVVHGELRIRRLFRNLPSSMFLVSREGDAWVFRGGGWGHGAGMCQWGAVGRAEAGHDYRLILRAYYSGAEVARIY